MAKMVTTYENGEIKKELTFRGEVFTLTMTPWEDGVRKSKEKALDNQVKERFSDDEDIDEIAEAVYLVDFSDDEEIEEGLERLEEFEEYMKCESCETKINIEQAEKSNICPECNCKHSINAED